MDPSLDTQPPPPSVPAEPSEPSQTASRPTHRLEKIKVGNHGVQLLVSTKDHLYDASDVEAGEDSWQVIGAWTESTVPDLAQILAQRSATPSRPLGQTLGQTMGQPRFGTEYGAGKTLGSMPRDSSGTGK